MDLYKMTIIGKLKTYLSAPYTKASKAGAFVSLHSQGRPVWTPRDYASFAKEGYAENAVVFRCVRMIAEAAASVPWRLFEKDRKLDTHPLLDLLGKPNPHQGAASWLEDLYAYLHVAGNAYVEAVEARGSVRELYTLRPDRMKVVPGPHGWPQGFEYHVDGRTVIFEPQGADGFMPVLHLKMFHPAHDHYGMSPIEAASYAIDTHTSASGWNKALLDNAAQPSGALVYTGYDGARNLTEEQFDRLKNELEDSYQGSKNAGRPLLLEGGLEWRQMSLSPTDMDFINAKHVAAREIALAFGVPPMLLGIPGDNTYANYREAQLAFWRQTILPLVGKTAKALTTWLVPRFGGDVRLSYDIDQVTALSLERELQWRRLNDATFLSVNEKRAQLGLPPVDGGDKITNMHQ